MANKTGKEGRSNGRVGMGRRKEEALFPAAPPLSDLPEDYAEILIKIKSHIQQERLRVVMAANSAMILLYWDVGKMILERQEHARWGAKIIDRLAKDLQEAFPGMKGFSPRNLKYMRAFSVAWPEREIVQEILAQITWYHNITLMEKLTGSEERLWYAHEIIKNGWSRNVLALKIESGLHERQGKAITNFRKILPLVDSDMATQVFKDPYLFDFLGTADLRRESEVEQALIDHIQHFLLELGAGFAFVGRQVPLEVASHDFRIDLLFYHLKLRCFVVIELKAVPFDPSFIGQLNFYLSAVDDLLRHPDDKLTIGLLLCRTKDKLVVEYALRDLNKPIGVAEWETKIVNELPKELESSLPTIEELEKELNEYEKEEKE